MTEAEVKLLLAARWRTFRASFFLCAAYSPWRMPWLMPGGGWSGGGWSRPLNDMAYRGKVNRAAIAAIRSVVEARPGNRTVKAGAPA